ncbi:MAG: GNAT family N-acetyltransferase [Sinobacteraceae bacterium]|nr:GNAT family N-acetyltransferase [Nevskiaceae bacterium]
MDIHEITDAEGRVSEPTWLARAEPVHRQLRPKLTADYAAELLRVFASGGRMAVAAEGETVLGVAVWRLLVKTSSRRELYVDDLVTDEVWRARGVGRALLAWLETRARDLACDTLALDSGTQRQRAHRFYFRAGFFVTSFHFVKKLA